MSSRPWQNERTETAGFSNGRENHKRSAAQYGKLWSMNILPHDKALLDALRLFKGLPERNMQEG